MKTALGLANTAADLIARLLKRRGVTRVFALCGGHIMPIWMRLDAEGIRIIDVRDEATAVFAADAVARLTGVPGVAAVTAGPGAPVAIPSPSFSLYAHYTGILGGRAVPVALAAEAAARAPDTVHTCRYRTSRHRDRVAAAAEIRRN